jgi:hypothetical protein
MFLASAYPAGMLALAMKLRVCSIGHERPISAPQSNPVGEKCSSGLTIKSALQHGSLGIKCKTETSEPIGSGTPAAAESFTAFSSHMRDRNAADFLGAP